MPTKRLGTFGAGGFIQFRDFDATVDKDPSGHGNRCLQLLRDPISTSREANGHGDFGVDGKQFYSSKEKWDDGISERC